MASLRRRKGSRNYYVRVYQGGRPEDIPTQTSDRKLALAIKKQIERDIVLGRFALPTSTPLRVALDKFIDNLQTQQEARCLDGDTKSFDNDVSRLRCLFGPIVPRLSRDSRGSPARSSVPTMLATRHLEELDREKIKAFLDDLVSDGLSVPTVNAYREILRRLFKFAKETMRFKSRDPDFPNPIDGIEKLARQRRAIEYMSLDEIGIQITALFNRPDLRIGVEMMTFGGERRSEVLWTMCRDIDLERREVRVTPKRNPDTGAYFRGKTRNSIRNFPMNDDLYDALVRWKGVRGESWKPNAWLIPNPIDGKWWHPDGFSEHLYQENKLHGLLWSSLIYRHSFACHNLQAGAEPAYLARYMGTSVAMIFEHYGTLIGATNRQAVQGISDSFRGRDQKRVELLAAPRESAVNRIERMIREAGKPITVADICAALNMRANQVRAVLYSDPRFRRGGRPKSATWSLQAAG